MKSFMIAVLVIFSINNLEAEEKKVATLMALRSEIKFLPLNNDDKFAIIRHAKILFSKVYVNLEHKMKLYQVDPVSELNKLEKKYHNLNETEFQEAMLAIFSSAHDYHTNYNLPKPYACYTAVLPVSFRKTGQKKIIVNAIRPAMKDSFPDLDKFTPGDELILYNQMTPLAYIETRKDIVASSTPDSSLMQGIYDLYYRWGGSAIIPKEDSVNLQLKKSNGEIYHVKVPWMAQYLDSCVNPVSVTQKGSLGKKIGKSGDSNIQMFKERNQFLKEMRKSFLKFFKVKNKSFSSESTEVVDLSAANKTNHPDLWWKQINWKNHNIGWLQLTSFDTPNGLKAAVAEVKKVLIHNLGDTSAVVIDLRGNPGGMIVFAEEMAALFTPRPVHPLPFYIRANDLTLALYDSDLSWKDIIMPYAETNLVVGPGSITTIAELSSISQAYFGKVVLLTNNECFSSCDLFSAAMKDNAHATIYGTDRSTMGGGANVWPHASLQEIFNKLDIPMELPQDISMRITGRHARRLSDNSLIEDKGVASDIMVYETENDVIDVERSSIMAKIFNDLIKIPGHMNSSQISLNLYKEFYQRHGNEELLIISNPVNIDQVAIFKNKKFVRRFYLDTENKITINLPLPADIYGQDSFEIYGFSKNAGTKFPILRKSIITESLGAFRLPEEIDPITHAVMTNSQRNEKCNWIKTENTLELTGPYCPEGKIDVTESLKLSSGEHSLSFDLLLDAEPTFDFFDVSVITNGVEEKLMAPISDPVNGHYEYDLSKYAGKNIDIRFRLTSDEASSGKGVVLSNLIIK